MRPAAIVYQAKTPQPHILVSSQRLAYAPIALRSSSIGDLANRAVRSELILTKMRIAITIAIVRAKQPAAGELWYGWG